MKQAVLILLMSFFGTLFSASLQEQAEEEIRSFYGESVTLTFSKMTVDPQTKAFIEESAKQQFRQNFVYFWVIDKGQFDYAFAIVDQVKAKSAMITVLALFDKDGAVEKIKILKYVGEHGRSVLDDHWLSQFEGKDRTSDFRIGSGVDAMTGASFSSQTIARGVHRWALLVNTLKEKCELPVH